MRATRHWSDQELLQALRDGSAHGFREFIARFQPLLQAYARKARIPSSDWPTCIDELLNDIALAFHNRSARQPGNLAAYLVTSVRRKHMRLRQAAASRLRRAIEASADHSGERVVSAVCSRDAIRASAGSEDEAEVSAGVLRLVRDLSTVLSPEELELLGWLGEGVSRPTIAKWKNIKPDTCDKRASRLCKKARDLAERQAAAYSSGERRDVQAIINRGAKPDRRESATA